VYQADEKDKVVELSDFPAMETGDPSPLVFSAEGKCILAYRMRHNVDWANTKVEDIEPERVALIDFQHCLSRMFGHPNEDVIRGHPLYDRGLSWYGFFEVENSSWLRKLEQINSVHEQHDRERFLNGFHHFIFTFHDSTFECIAKKFEVSIYEQPVDIKEEMQRRLPGIG
jgi:hypothetical protein